MTPRILIRVILLTLGIVTAGRAQQSTEIRLTRIEESFKTVSQRFDAVDKRIDDLNQNLNRRIDDTNQRVEALRLDVTARLDDMNKKFDWIFGLLFAIFGVIAGLFGYLLVSARQTSPRRVMRALKQLSARNEELDAQIRAVQTEIAALKRPAT